MSIDYYHSITVMGDSETITDFKNSYQDRLRESIVASFAKHAFDNDICDIISLPVGSQNTTCVEFVDSTLEYNLNP